MPKFYLLKLSKNFYKIEIYFYKVNQARFFLNKAAFKRKMHCLLGNAFLTNH